MATARSSPAARLGRSAAAALRASGRRGGVTRTPAALSPASHWIRCSNPTAPYVPTRNHTTFSSAPFCRRIPLSRSYSSAASSQISNSEFTEMAWDGILGAVDAAKDSKQQVVETKGWACSKNIHQGCSQLITSYLTNQRFQGNSFLSVEHLVLAFPLDKRFGQTLFKDLQLSEQALKDAVHAIRGSQRVNDQS